MTDATLKLKNLASTFGKQTEVLANVVLDNPKFDLWTGAGYSFQHHYGQGQLAQHTLEVAELSLRNNIYFMGLNKGVDEKQLFLSAVYHDVGKIYDYAPKLPETGLQEVNYNVWHKTEHHPRIYHISRSAIIWSKAFDEFGDTLSTEVHDDVLHAILAHHGRHEWRSTSTPKTRMAWLLHLSDCMSARVDDCIKEKPSLKT
jgi:3'-5' exoribonuclease